MQGRKTLTDSYRFPGFSSQIESARSLWGSHGSRGGFGAARKKNVCGVCGKANKTFYDHKKRQVRDLSCGDARVYLEVEVRRVGCPQCGKVKQEKLDWLADNPFYTKRFAFFVGRRCRSSTIKDVAKELHLDWQTVKTLEKQ